MEDPVAQTALAIIGFIDLVIPCYTLVEVMPWLLKLPSWMYAMPSQALAGAGLGRKYFSDLYKEAAA